MIPYGIPIEREPAKRPYVKGQPVTIEDLCIAAEWLDVNDGEDGEMDACQRVIDWIHKEIDARQMEITVRTIAKELGLTVPQVRQQLKKEIQ